MNLLLILSILTMLSSCALMKNVKNNILGYNYQELKIGEQLNSAIIKRGSPVHIYTSNNENLYLYKDGFIHFKDNKIVNKGNYLYSLQQRELLSTHIRKGSDLFQLIPHLGLPHSIEQMSSNYLIRYNRGVIVGKGSEVLLAIDKVYSDLIFKLGINAYTDNSSKDEGAYLIVPGTDKIGPNDFQFKEVKKTLATSMRLAGMKVTESPEIAKYLVFVNYGISDPKEDIKIISKPVYVPNYIPGTNYNFYGANGSYIGAASTSGTWTSQYAGQRTETIKTVSYSRWLNVEAVDFSVLRNTKTLKPVWKVLTNSNGSSGDLRFVLPALCYGAINYINQDTQRELYFTVGSNTLNDFIYKTKFSDAVSRDIAGKK